MEKDEIAKLAVLLSHWIKHNDDHMEEYKKWAETAERHGLKQVANNLMAAAELMLKSNDKFVAARREMPVSSHQERDHHGHDHGHEH